MLTLNGYKYAALFDGLAGTVTVKAMNGTDAICKYYSGYLAYMHPGSLMSRIRINNQDVGVMLGTGNTEPTLDDYKLAGDWITTISATTTKSQNNDDSGASITYVYSITNTGSSPITIGEVALAASLYTTSNQIKHDNPIIIERTALESPITIEPGGIGQVEYTIRMNYPVA